MEIMVLNKSLQQSDYIIIITDYDYDDSFSAEFLISDLQWNIFLRSHIIRVFNLEKKGEIVINQQDTEKGGTIPRIWRLLSKTLCLVLSFPYLENAKPSYLWQSIKIKFN